MSRPGAAEGYIKTKYIQNRTISKSTTTIPAGLDTLLVPREGVSNLAIKCYHKGMSMLHRALFGDTHPAYHGIMMALALLVLWKVRKL